MNLEAIEGERIRLMSCIKSACDQMFYSVHSKKGRDRICMLKKFQNAQNKVSNLTGYKPEAILRILRSYRLCLLHEYCHTLLRDCYLEMIKIQTVQVCNDLRTKAQLFPKPTNG